MNGERLARASRMIPLAAVGLAAAGLVAATVQLDRSLRQTARQHAGAELAAVARLKVAALAAWRDERERDTAFAASYPSVAELVLARGRGAVDARQAAHVGEILAHFAERQEYLRVEVLAPGGETVAGRVRATTPGDAFDPVLLAQALAQPGHPFSTLRDHTDDGDFFLDVAVAVHVVGAPPLVLTVRADARPLLASILETWPVPSPTAVAGLVRREGDAVVIYPSRRERTDGRPVLRPASGGPLPAAQAVAGATGLVDAVDLRGNPVLAFLAPVPGSTWRLVTKADLDEIEAPVRRPVLIIALLVAALVLSGAVALTLWWRHAQTRARMGEALREGADRLRLALAGAHSVWEWDLAQERLIIDHATDDGGARDPDVFLGGLDAILSQRVHPDDVPAVRAQLEAHLRGATPIFESEYRSPPGAGGGWRHVRGHATRRDEAGRATRLLGVISDVTERRELHAQLERSERMASLGTLAAGVAHEVNNPLASVIANLDAMAHELGAASPPALADLLAEVRDGAERVRDVVRGLRAFSGPTSGARRACDVGAEVEAAVRLARNEVRHRARLEVDLGPLPRVSAGPHELGQVFLNLIVNAAQAIPEGRAGQHAITVTGRTGPDGWAVVEVRDTGSGMPPEVVARAFEPFFTTKPHGVGTGLGLAIVHGIVAAAGGRIEVESVVGRGTTFTVRLPPAMPGTYSERPSITPPPRPPPPRAPGAGRPRVLVVDDDPLVVKAAARTLQREYAVTTAGAAAEALALVAAGEAFDALLCDLMMPQMTGMDLHEELTARDPALASRMVFITGGAFTERAAEFLRTVGNPCVEKPFDPEDLRAAVARAAQRAAPRQD